MGPEADTACDINQAQGFSVFQTFTGAFIPDELAEFAVVQAIPDSGDATVDDLLKRFGGQSFNQGIYRIISAGAVARWTERAISAFPNFIGRLTPFGVDWLGRLFALDSARRVDGVAAVVMLEPGTGQALEVPTGIIAFHNAELVQYSEEALAEGFYKNWRSMGGAAPRTGQCVGYKKPLFLGGSDTTENLELVTLEVYWEIAAQLLDKTRDFPVGTRVSNISIG